MMNETPGIGTIHIEYRINLLRTYLHFSFVFINLLLTPSNTA